MTVWFTGSGSGMHAHGNLFSRVILIVVTDGDGLPGPPATVLIDFDRTCSVWLDEEGNTRRILEVPADLPDYTRLGLCTAVTVERLQILDSEAITSLWFMENITVSPTALSLTRVC